MFTCSCSSLTTLPKTFRQKVDFFMLKMQKFWGRRIFFKKTSKFSSRIVKLSFDIPAGFFAESAIFFLLKIWKMVKRYMFFFPKELLKKNPRTCRMPFWQPWWSVFAEKPKYFAVNERKWWKFLNFSKNFFPQNFPWVTYTADTTTLPKCFCPKSQIFY